MCEFSGCFVPVERIPEALEVLSLKSTLIGEVFPQPPPALGRFGWKKTDPECTLGKLR